MKLRHFICLVSEDLFEHEFVQILSFFHVYSRGTFSTEHNFEPLLPRVVTILSNESESFEETISKISEYSELSKIERYYWLEGFIHIFLLEILISDHFIVFFWEGVTQC